MKNQKTLRNLSKLELLELLAEQETEIETLKKQLAEKDAILQQRILQMNDAGNLAQAALRLNGVFEAAQRAASQYVESVKLRVDQSVEATGTLPHKLCEQVAVPDADVKYPKSNGAAASRNISVDDILKSLDKNKAFHKAVVKHPSDEGVSSPKEKLKNEK